MSRLSETNKQVIRDFVEATNNKDWPKFDELVADNVLRNTSTSGQPVINSKEKLKLFHLDELQTFPDLREEIVFLIGEGDMVAARIHFSGTQLGQMGPFPPTGRQLIADFNCFFRVSYQKIREIWVEYDNLNGLIQLGHFQLPEEE